MSKFKDIEANVIDLQNPLLGASAGRYIKGQVTEVQVLDSDGEVMVRADKDGKAVAKTQKCVILAVRVPTLEVFNDTGWRYSDGVRVDKKTGQSQSWFSKTATVQSPYPYAQKWQLNIEGQPITMDMSMSRQYFQNEPFEGDGAPAFGTMEMKHKQHQQGGEVIKATQDKYEEPAVID